MKKIFLLGALVCAGQMYGMEDLYPKQGLLTGTWENLPTEVKSLIIRAVAQSDNDLDKAIKNIVRLSQVNKELNKMIDANYGNLEGFTALVHMLADKFNSTTEDVAKKFETPASKIYLHLASQLDLSIMFFGKNKNIKIAQLINLIKKGADVNYTYDTSFEDVASTLTRALAHGNVEIIKLLLNNGANPNLKDVFGRTAFEWVEQFTVPEEIKQLLENYKK